MPSAPGRSRLRRLDRYQFVLHVMELDQLGMYGRILKMSGYRFENITPKLIPAFGIREDAVPECARVIAAFLRIADFEDQFHENRISRPLARHLRQHQRSQNARPSLEPRRHHILLDPVQQFLRLHISVQNPL